MHTCHLANNSIINFVKETITTITFNGSELNGVQ